MLLSAAVLLASLAYAWWTAHELPHTRNFVLAAGIVSGVGATACLAGAMRFINARLKELESARPAERWSLVLFQRILMLAELACMILAAASAAALLFGFKIPGT
jgi:hypothetical protein